MFCIVRAQKSNIYIAPIDATTPYSISCSNLLDAFPETIKKVKLNDKQSKEIYLLTSVLKKNDNKPYTNIRYKGIIGETKSIKNKRYARQLIAGKKHQV